MKFVVDEPLSEACSSGLPMEMLHTDDDVQQVMVSDPDHYEPMGGGRFQLQTEDQHSAGPQGARKL